MGVNWTKHMGNIELWNVILGGAQWDPECNMELQKSFLDVISISLKSHQFHGVSIELGYIVTVN